MKTLWKYFHTFSHTSTIIWWQLFSTIYLQADEMLVHIYPFYFKLYFIPQKRTGDYLFFFSLQITSKLTSKTTSKSFWSTSNHFTHFHIQVWLFANNLLLSYCHKLKEMLVTIYPFLFKYIYPLKKQAASLFSLFLNWEKLPWVNSRKFAIYHLYYCLV